MKAVFADASYFVALVSSQDQAHSVALDWAGTYSGELVTSTWVLTEVGNYLSRKNDRGRFIALLDDLVGNRQFNILPTTQDQFNNGLALYRDRADKEWSLTDCISFAIMQEHDLTEAATTDHHFAQAGFRSVLE